MGTLQSRHSSNLHDFGLKQTDLDGRIGAR